MSELAARTTCRRASAKSGAERVTGGALASGMFGKSLVANVATVVGKKYALIFDYNKGSDTYINVSVAGSLTYNATSTKNILQFVATSTTSVLEG